MIDAISRRRLAVGVVAIVALVTCGCGPQRHDFPDYSTADQLKVVNTKTLTISDPAQIENVAAFFNQFHEGWTDSFVGNGVTGTSLIFYKNGENIGGFGLGNEVLTQGA